MRRLWGPDTTWPALRGWLQQRGFKTEEPSSFPGLAIVQHPEAADKREFFWLDVPNQRLSRVSVENGLYNLGIDPETF